MDQNRLTIGLFPLLGLATVICSVPPASGRAAASHYHSTTESFDGAVSWLLSGLAMEADIEASEAEAQLALMSAILGGAPAELPSGSARGAEMDRDGYLGSAAPDKKQLTDKR